MLFSEFVNARRYQRKYLAQELELDEALLPLFASLLGNDWVSKNVLARFHAKIHEEEVDRFKSLARLLSQYKTVQVRS